MWLNLLRLWTGPLPHEELFPDRKINPVLHWLIHPAKRRLAKYYVWILQHFFGLKVIAITGSSGKTTTSNMLYSVLSGVGPTVKTADSVTSTYNIPTSILKCTFSTRFLVLEMGVEYIGDMDFYCWLVRPDIGTVLNISPVHAHYLGTIENIRAEKSKLLSYSRFGLKPEDFPSVISSVLTPDLKTEIKMLMEHKSYLINLQLLGLHFSQNAAAVAAVAGHLNIAPGEIVSGLESVTPPPHRMQIIPLNSDRFLIDDTYNANPLSVTAAINTLSQITLTSRQQPVFVFGQMNELGKYEQSEHEKIGFLLKNLKLKIKNFELFCIGPATKYTVKSAGFGHWFDRQDDLLYTLKKLLVHKPSFVILVKGSRTWHLENLLPGLSGSFS